MVAPDLRGRGLGRWLLAYVETAAPPEATRLALFTGAQSVANLRMYRKAGYRTVREQPDQPGVVQLSKRVRR
jgi:tRNA (guanine37-N1)-methyltransferase